MIKRPSCKPVYHAFSSGCAVRHLSAHLQSLPGRVYRSLTDRDSTIKADAVDTGQRYQRVEHLDIGVLQAVQTDSFIIIERHQFA
jgi:hypothetical protein